MISLSQSTRVSNENLDLHKFPISFLERWKDLQFDGSIEALDLGVETMVSYATQWLESKTDEERKAALEELECASFATSLELRKTLAYIPGRLSIVPLEIGNFLFEAVSQFLLYTHNDIKWAILRGVKLLRKCCSDILEISDLSKEEIAYREWVTLYLFHHLIPYSNDVFYENMPHR